MNVKEIIIEGRKFANGDDREIDLRSAYELWSQVEEYLSGDDLDTYLDIVPIFLETSDDSYSEIKHAADVSVVIPSDPEELKGALGTFLETASKDQLVKLYEAMTSITGGAKKKACAKTSEKTELHTRMGNNLGCIMRQFSWNRAVFLSKMKDILVKEGKTLSSAALSMILNGVNGMSSATMHAVVTLANEANEAAIAKGKRILKAPMKIESLYLTRSEIIALFVEPKPDILG